MAEQQKTQFPHRVGGDLEPDARYATRVIRDSDRQSVGCPTAEERKGSKQKNGDPVKNLMYRQATHRGG